jgi:hypothetical protein
MFSNKMEPYHSYFPYSKLLLQETDKLAKCVMYFPTGTSVNLEEITNYLPDNQVSSK